MQYKVPQIEHETKVIGPFTFTQFVYLGVPVAISFIFYFTAPLLVFLAIAAPLIGGGLALGLVKVGGQSIPQLVLNMLNFSVAPKTYIWKRRGGKGGAAQQGVEVYGDPKAAQNEKSKKVALGKAQETKVSTMAKKVQTDAK